jgi:hypothetical protein
MQKAGTTVNHQTDDTHTIGMFHRDLIAKKNLSLLLILIILGILGLSQTEYVNTVNGTALAGKPYNEKAYSPW